ncbi:MAG: hypothetical protein M3P32_02500 [Chloroflexota bacterium]|nr:hypothetical protein [Chloroflexota bacterium]
MKTLKTLGISGGLIAAALVGGTLINAVAAAPSGSSATNDAVADPVDAARYCALWQETFADELGVSVDELVPAAKAATIATIDAAVAAGDLPQDVADRMKAAIDKADGDGCRLLGAAFHGWGRHAAKVELGVDLFGAAATALDMTKAELFTALRSGDSLEEIATAEGKDYAAVSQAIHDAAKANLDELVAADKLTQERADAFLANLDEALASGEFPRHRPWHRGDRDGGAPADALAS